MTVNGLVAPAARRAVQRVIARSHFSVSTVALPPGNGLFVQVIWPVKQTAFGTEECYLELEIIRPMFPNPQRLIATLPDSRFTTEMDPTLVVSEFSPTFTIATGQLVDVFASFIFRREATPPPVNLDIYLALRMVLDKTTQDPTKVGPIIAGGEHPKQVSVIQVVETALAAIGQPGMVAFSVPV